jgi:hypothetical protein
MGDKKNITVSRRNVLAGLAISAATIAVPATAMGASSSGPTKANTAYLSFEIDSYKKSADKYERVINRTNVVDKNSSDDNYPTAKSVYSFIVDKVNYTQGVTEAGKSLFIGTDGKVCLKTYKVDEDLSIKSSNPVQGKVIYEEIQDIKKSFTIDDKPKKCTDAGCPKVHKDEESGYHVSTSGGMYQTYQETNDFPGFDQCVTGVTYAGTISGIASTTERFGIKKNGDTMLALTQDEFSGFYSRDKSGNWKVPKVVWHT